MGSDLYAAEPAFRRAIDDAATIVQARTAYDPRPAFAGGAAPPSKRDQLVLLGLVQLGQLDLWRAAGVTPDAVVALSLGEPVAAHAAGALTREEAVAVLCSITAPGAGPADCVLFGIEADADQAARTSADAPVPVDVLGTTEPAMTMMICALGDRDEARDHLRARHRILRELAAQPGYHSARLPSSLRRMERELGHLRPQRPDRPCFLASSGRDVSSDGVLDAHYWAWMLDHPYWYAEVTAGAFAAGQALVVQIGAEPHTTPYLATAAAGAGHRLRVFETTRPGSPSTRTWRRARRRFALAARRPVVRRAPEPPRTGFVDDPEVRRHPWPVWDALRAKGGIDRAGPDGEWVVVDHALATDVLARPLEFSSAAWRDGQEMSLIAVDPPEHGPLRRIVRDVLAPEVVDPLAAQVRSVARELAEPLAARREFDAVSELAEPVTERTAARLLEIDERDLKATDGGGPGDRQLGAARPGLLASRAAVTERVPLEPAEAHKLVRFLWLAGIVTTIRNLAWTMYELDRHRELRETVAADRAAARAFLDEVLRLHAPAWYVPRVAIVDTTLGDVRIAAGDGLLVVIGAATRDPAVFEDPHRIALNRPRVPQLVFGHGPHRCPGARLAKLAAEEVLGVVLETMPEYRVLQPEAALRYEDGRDAHGLAELTVAPVP